MQPWDDTQEYDKVRITILTCLVPGHSTFNYTGTFFFYCTILIFPGRSYATYCMFAFTELSLISIKCVLHEPPRAKRLSSLNFNGKTWCAKQTMKTCYWIKYNVLTFKGNDTAIWTKSLARKINTTSRVFQVSKQIGHPENTQRRKQMCWPWYKNHSFHCTVIRRNKITMQYEKGFGQVFI